MYYYDFAMAAAVRQRAGTYHSVSRPPRKDKQCCKEEEEEEAIAGGRRASRDARRPLGDSEMLPEPS